MPHYDFPEPKMMHHFGAANVHNAFTKHFRGFIWSASAFRGTADATSISFTCDGHCDVCPQDSFASDTCLGQCNWNHYEVAGNCKRCPLWCRSGCDNNGKC